MSAVLYGIGCASPLLYFLPYGGDVRCVVVAQPWLQRAMRVTVGVAAAANAFPRGVLDKYPVLSDALANRSYSITSDSRYEWGVIMAKWTPEQEADYALHYGTERSSLSKPAQQVYDRLLQERREKAQALEATDDQHTTVGESGGSLNCSECGEEFTPNARFCASCGEPVDMKPQDTHCSECGEELTPNARFCASCGEPVNIRSAGRAPIRDSASNSGESAEETLQEFSVKFVTFYDGSGHRLGPSECILTTRRLIINDVRGGIHQIVLRDISGTSTPSRIGDPKTLRISLPAQAYDITFNSKDQKYAVEARLGQAIRGSLK